MIEKIIIGLSVFNIPLFSSKMIHLLENFHCFQTPALNQLREKIIEQFSPIAFWPRSVQRQYVQVIDLPLLRLLLVLPPTLCLLGSCGCSCCSLGRCLDASLAPILGPGRRCGTNAAPATGSYVLHCSFAVTMSARH